MRYLLALVLMLAFPCLSNAASRTIEWDAYTAPSDFKEFRVYRATQNCTAQGPLAPLLVNGVPVVIPKPTSGALPTSYVDTTVPVMEGTLCYEITVVDVTGNESVRSNRGSLAVDTNPPSAVTGVRVK